VKRLRMLIRLAHTIARSWELAGAVPNPRTPGWEASWSAAGSSDAAPRIYSEPPGSGIGFSLSRPCTESLVMPI
jgi:hypothetical protein